MFTLIFAIIWLLLLIVKIYETIKYRDKLDRKTILYMILALIFVVAVFLEKVLKVSI